MSPVRQLLEVAKRDFVQRAKSKAFMVTTLLTVTIIVGIAPLLALQLRDDDPSTVGVLGSVDSTFRAALGASSDAVGIETEIETFADAAALEEAVSRGRADVGLVDDSELVWAERVDQRLRVAVASAVQEVRRSELTAELGLEPVEAAGLVAPPAPEDRVLEPPSDDELPRAIGAQAGVFVLYMSILIFGQFVLMGVMEEKQSRVVEVVLSRTEPNRLLAGKILGIGLLGIVQILLIGGAIILAASMIDLEGVSLPSLSAGILASIIVWYLLGYAFYATIYGAMGATISRQEDAQGAVMIPALLIIPGFFISMLALEDPDSMVAVVGSLLPISAPMVMPVRFAMQAASWWEMALAAGLLVVTTWLLVNLAARIYRGAILSIGAKVRLRDAWRAARV
ncbi:MAG TPA: ABC transporter permease [Acidimicrobiia bacterium]